MLVTTGNLKYLDDLRERPFRAGVVAMLRIPGLGPKKAKFLHEMGLDSIEKLKAACESGEVAKQKGFGAKTQQNILEGVRVLLVARPVAGCALT